MSKPPVPHPVDPARRLTAFYVCALTLVAVLSVAGQFLVQRQLARQLDDSKVVNLAGRQRMLSQRACKCAALSADSGATVDRPAYRDELRTLLPTWTRTHDGLQHGDAELGLPNDTSPQVAAVFQRLNPTFDALRAAAERLLAADDLAATRQAARDMLAYEAEYLRGMDEIVSQYEAEGRRRVARLQTVERVLLGLTLFVLLLEGTLVFRPAVRRIRESLEALRRGGEELRVAKEAAEAANRTKSLFLANMSHELRTPLHAVLGAAELLRESDASPRQAEFVETIEDSSRMLSCLLNDLLDLSRIEADKMELHPAPFELRPFLRHTAAMFRAAAEVKGLVLAVEVDDAAASVATTDSLRLRQVLANLLSNAVKFSDAGRITLRVTSSPAAEAAGVVRFEVRDEGRGIAPEDRARIFESFTQLPGRPEHNPGGAGLGLAIAAQLVARMHGRLEVAGEPGRGSTFWFEIPCAAADGASATTGERTATPTVRPLRVLAADDAPAGRRILETLLAAEGHDVRSVADGRAAAAAFQAEPCDIALLDLRMPELDGIAAAAAIRQWERELERPRTPIVAITADLPGPDVVGPGNLDFDDYLAKPFSAEELRRIIARNAGRLPECASQRTLHFAPAQEAKPSVEQRAANVLTRLKGRRALLEELVQLFLEDAPRLRDDLFRAWDDRDLPRLRLVVHRLRGQLELFEAADVAVLARMIEQACEQHGSQVIAESLVRLEDLWPEMLESVRLLTRTSQQVSAPP